MKGMKKSKIEKKTLKCGWCRQYFIAYLIKDKDGERTPLKCSKCGTPLSASKKIPTGNVVGRKHTHTDYKEGDTAY